MMYAIGTIASGLLVEIWLKWRDPSHVPELGYAVAVGGLIVFGALFAFCLHSYGRISRAMREQDVVRADALCLIVGLTIWPVLTATHEFSRDRLGLPDAMWWLEAVVLSALAFELVHFAKRMLRRRDVLSDD